MNNKFAVLKYATEFQKCVNANKATSKQFFFKWGIPPNKISDALSDINVHGGILSKTISIKNVCKRKILSVANIGPEMGVEVLMLANQYAKVYVFDPDSDNLKLISSILKNSSLKLGEIKYFSAGLENRETSKKEKFLYKSAKKILGRSFLTYYNVTPNKEIKNINFKTDLIYIHKILTTISRSSTKSKEEIFNKSLKSLIAKLNKHGIISWTEPEFVWRGVDLKQPKMKTLSYKLPKCKDEYIQLIYENN